MFVVHVVQSKPTLSLRYPAFKSAALAILASASVLSAAEVDFLHDIIPLLSRFGCNGSACHGKAEGQNGFKLSVFGNDPAADHKAIVQETRGRRISFASPANSLLLHKVSGEKGHGGGVRIPESSRAHSLIKQWIHSGARFDSGARPAITDLRVDPPSRVLASGSSLQLRVFARYADGRDEDVTWLSIFHSNNDTMAKVSEDGLVTTGRSIGHAAIMAKLHGHIAVHHLSNPRVANDTLPRTPLPVQNTIDTWIDANLLKLNLRPSGLSTDSDYLRRVYLDIIGALPTADESRAFLASKDPQRRAKLVDQLLARPEYVDYWTLKWADALRVDRLALGHKDAYAYYQWIHETVKANKGLDRMARELLLAEGPLTEQPAGLFYKVAKRSGEMSAMSSQVFLGVRITCAECHQHPYDRWTQQDYHGLRGFFEQVKFKNTGAEESLFVDGQPEIKHPRTGTVIKPYPLGATMPTNAPTGDRRTILADWMTTRDNPWFARNMANRIWAHFLGRGLIEPIDDVRMTNPPSNPELLDALARYLGENKFDAKQLIRLITASSTYQLSSEPNAANEMDESNHSRALFRRLPAEVLMDAVCDVTGVQEKFSGVPAGYKAVQLWDSQVQDYFLTLFGRPVRASVCECERATGASISQVLHLMNSATLQTKLSHDGGRIAKLAAKFSDDALVDELYLTFFSRYPDQDEMKKAVAHLKSRSEQRRHAVEDLAWAMLNSTEFAFNH
ncbi:MAG: DUF1553 domain-containing protein [Pedosphaera sp.]|nr:DUF1553 domain-containing protein [Pedosphaera sp.]